MQASSGWKGHELGQRVFLCKSHLGRDTCFLDAVQSKCVELIFHGLFLFSLSASASSCNYFTIYCCRLAFGNESGLAIVDFIQKTCLLNLGTPDLYGKCSKVLYPS